MQKFFTLFASFILIIVANAQPNDASSSIKSLVNSNINGGSINWTYTPGINGTVTNISVPFQNANAESSVYAKLTDFGFSIPIGHQIKGIEAYVTRTGGNNVEDEHIYIIKDGTIQTAVDLKATGNWATNGNQVQTVKYGSPTQLWGTTWTRTQVNNSGFGMAISIKKGGNNSTTAVISTVRIVVYYEAAITLPVHFMGLEAKKATGGVLLTWKVGGEENVKGYEVERSFNGSAFSKIAFVSAAGSASYTYTDARAGLENAYFRVKSLDNDGSFLYSPVVRYNNGKAGVVMKVFPTSVAGNLTVQHEESATGSAIIISSSDGRFIKSMIPGNGAIQTSVDVSALKPGMYLVHFRNKLGKTETGKFFKN